MTNTYDRDHTDGLVCEHRPFEYASQHGPRHETVPCRVCRIALRPADEWVTTLGAMSAVTCGSEVCRAYAAESLRAGAGRTTYDRDLTASLIVEARNLEYPMSVASRRTMADQLEAAQARIAELEAAVKLREFAAKLTDPGTSLLACSHVGDPLAPKKRSP